MSRVLSHPSTAPPPEGARLTAEEFFAANVEGPCELVAGRVQRMAPAGDHHGGLSLGIGARLWQYVRASGLGRTVGAETGFVLHRNPDTVRAPDAAFIARERQPHGPAAGFVEGAPDLAVEVLSPGDRPAEVAAKTREWLTAGARQVWVLNPARRSVSVYFADGRCETLDERQTLTGGDLLPGFQVPVAELFEA